MIERFLNVDAVIMCDNDCGEELSIKPEFRELSIKPEFRKKSVDTVMEAEGWVVVKGVERNFYFCPTCAKEKADVRDRIKSISEHMRLQDHGDVEGMPKTAYINIEDVYWLIRELKKRLD